MTFKFVRTNAFNCLNSTVVAFPTQKSSYYSYYAKSCEPCSLLHTLETMKAMTIRRNALKSPVTWTSKRFILDNASFNSLAHRWCDPEARANGNVSRLEVLCVVSSTLEHHLVRQVNLKGWSELDDHGVLNITDLDDWCKQSL
ncbi:hypothetical protein BDQ12DRAFT_3139 [Crucibulum laeve]|uniref:Uncharacterized protein n=1 Tax=Crucibulum laeve TaxID=68775 RepID=A0A5C3MGR2_9AGAR|nr:hypothetical protein BDQ12DRAFT_3139 [Crucibulum laeve]